MKNVSKLSLLIIAIAIIWAIVTVVLVATGYVIHPLDRVLLIGYSVLSAILIVTLTISLDMAFGERNDLLDKPPIVLTKFNAHKMERLTHEIYLCPNGHNKFCKDCNHRLPHEHTPECDINGCEVCVRVIN